MESITEQPSSDNTETMIDTTSSPAHCPIDHNAWSWQKTVPTIPSTGPAVECDQEGVWHVRSLDAARAVLRSANTKQAGFNAELIARIPNMMNQPILYQDGKVHQQQRKQTARFFTPKAVSDNYRVVMEKLSDQLVKKLLRKKQVDLSQLSITLAVRVAGQVVGLTNSYPGLPARLEAFFSGNLTDLRLSPRTVLNLLKNQTRTLAFFSLDVLPAIRARKRRPQNDVISHLLAQNYSNAEILTECITYAAAGMVTTREFISVAAWHLLERPELRKRYLIAPEEERHAMLHEILRVEPVVTRLYRRATDAIELENEGAPIIIPPDAKVTIEIDASNADESIVGDLPLAVRPRREMKGDRVPEMVMSFGDGVHRCPGAYIAIQETDIFLQHLLAIPSLRIVSKPSIRWNTLTTGYELRNFDIAVD
jgi:cytochrome P450